MFNSNSSFKLVMILAIMVGSFLLYIIYLILFTPNGLVGAFQ